MTPTTNPTSPFATAAARAEHVARGVAETHPIFVARAEGARVWDTEGREYLDFIGGIGVLNTGHRHPRVMEAVRRQLDAFTHTCFQVASYDGYVELAARLNRLVGGGPNKTLLLTTGVEATENAVKIARAATNRPGVVAFHGGFHGRTLLGLALTASSTGYRQNFGPFAPEVYHAPFPYEYRGISDRAGAGGAAVPVRLADRARPGGRDHHRAATGRGRLRAGAGGLPARAAAPRAPPTASCSSSTRSRPASAAPAGCSPTSTTASSPTW